MSVVAHNPIMPGFYPDPSICAVGEDYYLVNSTFAYFPGLPVMHSKDLCHWEQIGNAMDRKSQLVLKNAGHSAGLFAPTIRYYDGIYYIICTNVSFGGNFIIKAENPEGPWSEPFYIQGAGGIDPSLFFDDDGKCYYIGTHPNPEGCRYNGDWYIWIQELDIKEMKLVGEHKDVWNGAMRNIIWPEGPHLYKKDGYYYIMHAEGGTGPDHAVTVCRSREIWGPYENNFCNPILTHRHLGQEYPIKYVGHADMIRTIGGEWFMVMLAVRPKKGCTTMGRETFLAKVTWENDWPVVNKGVGMLTEQVEIDLPEWDPEEDENSFSRRSGSKNCVPGSSRTYDFTRKQELGDEFLALRNPPEDFCRLKKKEGLAVRLRSVSLKEQDTPSYLAIRQQHHSFMVTACLDPGSLRAGDDTQDLKAGIALMQSNEYHLRLEVSAKKVEAILCEKGLDKVLGSMEYKKTSQLKLFLRVTGLTAALGIKEEQKEYVIVENVDIRSLSTEVAGGFVGCTVGMYAVMENVTKGNASQETAQEENAANEREVGFKEFSYVAL